MKMSDAFFTRPTAWFTAGLISSSPITGVKILYPPPLCVRSLKDYKKCISLNPEPPRLICSGRVKWKVPHIISQSMGRTGSKMGGRFEAVTTRELS